MAPEWANEPEFDLNKQDARIEAPRSRSIQAPRSQDVQAPRGDGQREDEPSAARGAADNTPEPDHKDDIQAP